MSRKKLSEYRAKKIMTAALGQNYEGISVRTVEPDWRDKITALSPDQTYVVKVDQAIKGRYKKGLVQLDQSASKLVDDILTMQEQGFSDFIVEPFKQHAPSSERYFACTRTRQGIEMSYSPEGGVDVESHTTSLEHVIYLPGLSLPKIGLNRELLGHLVQCFEANYFSFLEINPLLVEEGSLTLLDAAVEVDDTAEFFVRGNWSGADLRNFSSKQLTPQEIAVRELAEQSQASFNLEVLNQNGNIFVLLSGGGASVVVADEISNMGLGEQLANYGEYSGNPTREETQTYTSRLLQLLVESTARQKVLIIGGGVANFTDVRATFAGVIDALKDYEKTLRKQAVKVYVRRGGPYEKEGLEHMKSYLDKAGLLGAVHGPELVLTDIVKEATANLEAIS